ncbi:hypothetical protein FRC07_010941, partial [Ceratobasidium sp. 392]
GYALEPLRRVLSGPTNWHEMSRAVAFEALCNSGEAMTDTNSLYDLYKAVLHPSFVTPKVETETDSSFLVRVLWDDRASFLKLCIHGLPSAKCSVAPESPDLGG